MAASPPPELMPREHGARGTPAPRRVLRRACNHNVHRTQNHASKVVELFPPPLTCAHAHAHLHQTHPLRSSNPRNPLSILPTPSTRRPHHTTKSKVGPWRHLIGVREERPRRLVQALRAVCLVQHDDRRVAAHEGRVLHSVVAFLWARRGEGSLDNLTKGMVNRMAPKGQ